MRAYTDSDVLIWYLRGEAKARAFLQKMCADEDYDLWIGAAQRAEIVFFMRPSEEVPTLHFLTEFKTAPIDRDIVDSAGALFRTYHPSHGTDINDCFLAAIVMKTGGRLYTLNSTHYPMSGLSVRTAW